MDDIDVLAPQIQRSTLQLGAVLAGLNLAVFIAALDQTVVAPAVASIVSHFNSSGGYSWIAGAYLLANAASGPIWAAVSDIWGRKWILLTAVALFFASSVICAKASSMEMLIVGRALQGTAGGGLLQLVIITLSDIFSVRSRGLALGLTEVMWCLSGGTGPLLGGLLTEGLSWRWIFWINLPISGGTFLLLLVFLDVHDPKTKLVDGIKAIDWFGSVSIIGLTLMLLLGLDFGGTIAPWNSPKVICLIVFGAFMSVLFIYSEKRLAKFPLMPLKMFEHRSNIASFAVNFLHGFVFIGAEYYIPFYLQSAKELSPFHSGLLSLPIPVGTGIMGIFCGVYIHRTGRYLELIWTGTFLLAVGTGMYIALDARAPVPQIIGSGIVGGVGAGLLFSPPLLALQALVSQEDTATASATYGFVRNIATSMSVVIGGTIFANSMDLRANELRKAGLPEALVEKYSGHEAAASVLRIREIENQAHREAVKDAYAWSLRNMWILYTGMAALSVVAGMFVARSVLSKNHTETRTGLNRKEDSPSPDQRDEVHQFPELAGTIRTA